MLTILVDFIQMHASALTILVDFIQVHASALTILVDFIQVHAYYTSCAGGWCSLTKQLTSVNAIYV